MHVAIDHRTYAVATRVWFDRTSGRLFVEFDGIVESIELALIPEADFESPAPISAFALGCEGSVVVCLHTDGTETWLPVDLWQPGGFTPPAAVAAAA